MLFFIVIFASDFNIVDFVNNNQEYNGLEQDVPHNEVLDGGLDAGFFDIYFNVYEQSRVEEEQFLDMNSGKKEKSENNNLNESVTENGDDDIILIENNCDSSTSKNMQSTSNDNERDDGMKFNEQIKQDVSKSYLWNRLRQHNNAPSQHTFNGHCNSGINPKSLTVSSLKTSQPGEHSFVKIDDGKVSTVNTLLKDRIETNSKLCLDLPSTSYKINYQCENINTKKSSPISTKIVKNKTKNILNLSSQSNLNFNDLSFNNLIHEINLNNNGLTTIPHNVLSTESLETLNVSYNSITYIPEKISQLKNLKKLNVDNNKLEDIVPIQSLITLFIRNNTLKTIENINKMANIEMLAIDYNNVSLENLKLKRLKYLLMSYTNQTNLNFLKHCEELRILDCSNNKITQIQISNRKLFSLKANNNKISIFIPKENNIVSMEMICNILRKFELDFKLFRDLVSLNLSKNLIEEINIRNEEFSNLKCLDLSHNKLKTIDCRIGKIGLEFLDLSYNHLTFLSCKFIFSMTTLTSLNLQSNQIEFIDIINSKNLRLLSISNNPIKSLPEKFYDLPNIKQIHMSNLKIDRWPCFNEGLVNLEVLDLSNNDCNSIYCSPGALPTLGDVSLSNCKLLHFPLFFPIKNLQRLILSKNNLIYLPADFKILKGKIKILDLRYNPLEIFSKKNSLGALEILENFYGRVLLDDYILKNIRETNIIAHFYSKENKQSYISLVTSKENKMETDFYLNRLYKMLKSKDERIKQLTIEILFLIEEMRSSGFILFKDVMKNIVKIIHNREDQNINLERAVSYINMYYSSKLYRFLYAIISKYKADILRKAVILIYGSDDHYNYWIHYLHNILFLNELERFILNPLIHNDKNIVISCFVNNLNLNDLLIIIKSKLESDKAVLSLFYSVLSNTGEKSLRKRHINGNVKQSEVIYDEDIKYVLSLFQMIVI